MNGSLHTIPVNDDPGAARSEPYTLYRRWPADKVVRTTLAEVPRMLAGSSVFTVFCHIEYAVRYWPKDREGPLMPLVEIPQGCLSNFLTLGACQRSG